MIQEQGENKVRLSLLSDKRILEELQNGNIVIDPFKPENLKSVSLDVSVGKYYFKEQHPRTGSRLFNPYNKAHVEKIWALKEAEPAKLHMKDWPNSEDWDRISPEDLIILIGPGETILAHTEEFVGGRRGFTAMMKSRSSFGRVFIDACKSAGWGDVGYINRWTMEVTNFSSLYTIPLVVGRTLVQMVFFEVGPTLTEYHSEGKYQTSGDIEEIKRNWKPEDMLPKLWKDHQVQK